MNTPFDALPKSGSRIVYIRAVQTLSLIHI